MKKLALKLVVVLVAIGLLSACGFHLRGSFALPEALKTVRVVSSDPHGEFTRVVKQSLQKQGANLVENDEAAVLKLSNERFDRRVLSVSSDIEAKEYQLKYSTSFAVFDANGQVLVPSQSVQAVRDYELDAANESTRSSREARLKKQMQTELLQQIMRRIQAQLKS